MQRPSPEQIEASDPARSVWVNANAGSGKTTVLVNRVVRLLLAGADPARILCVTFTKAAAANMQDRIFKRLGEWVAMPDGELVAAVEAITDRMPGAAELVVARRLFARAVETPGGLKIQTIHAFCERLLHLFPFEAGVPARFEMLDEAQTAAAMDRSMTGTLRAALDEGGGALAGALRAATEAAGEDGVRQALAAFVRIRRDLPPPARERKFASSPVREALGVKPGATAEGMRREIVERGLYSGDWRAVESWLRSSGKERDKDMADFLVAGAGEQGARDAESYLRVFLSAEFLPRSDKGWFISSDLRKKPGGFLQEMLDERARVVEAHDALLAAAAAERSEAIALLADATLARYRAEKQRLGRLDFADLIGKARALLMSEASRWVLFKLDQGVDHILVDEAQDTSPEQWDIVKALSDDFFAGAGARGSLTRTIFAVGDEKQSIFGFQGARPEAFDAAFRHFRRRIDAHNQEAPSSHEFRPVPLRTSHRSTGDIMAAVDQVFSLPQNFAGLESTPQRTIHSTSRLDKPGLVELWPPEEPPPKAEDDPEAPVDARPPDASSRRLAARIARRIRWWLEKGERNGSTGRTISAGDVLILVRNRGPIFEDVIKALKEARVPVAGADRMRLTEQLAVMDLISLGRFCLNAEDDLALAEVLKSPLVGFNDAMLEAVAADRGPVSLWAALQRGADEDDACRAATARLARWRDMAAAQDPLHFYAVLLGPEGMRRRLIQRLGPDAAEAIDIFLYRLRQWQAANPPSLLLFLEAMAGDDSDVKRDMEEAHGRVRVMTVHGSKGLEAPIVFLADIFRGAEAKGPVCIEAMPGDPATAVWTPRKHEDPRALAAGRQHVETLEANEHRRLLYVGMTRAEDRLYIAGAMPGDKPKGHWHGMITAALDGHAGLSVVPDEAGEGEVWQWRTVVAPPAEPEELPPAEVAEPYDWLGRPAPRDLPRPPPVRPSRLADAAEPAPLRENLARRSAQRLRGDLVHLLFQHLPDLPADRRAAAGAALAAARFGGLDAEMREAAVAGVLGILDDPRWASLFGREARTEVDIAGKIMVAGRLIEAAGRIDRLLIAPGQVMVLDYKTGRPPARLAEVSEGHLRQLAVYRALARDLYPDRTVETAILWTEVPAVAVLDDAALDAAMQRIG